MNLTKEKRFERVGVYMNNKGQTTTEYVLLIGLIAIALIASLRMFGQSVNRAFIAAGNKVAEVTNAAPVQQQEGVSSGSTGTGNSTTDVFSQQDSVEVQEDNSFEMDSFDGLVGNNFLGGTQQGVVQQQPQQQQQPQSQQQVAVPQQPQQQVTQAQSTQEQLQGQYQQYQDYYNQGQQVYNQVKGLFGGE